MVTTERYKTALVIKHLKTALEAIKSYVEAKKPESLETATGMLTMVGMIAGEALTESELPSET